MRWDWSDPLLRDPVLLSFSFFLCVSVFLPQGEDGWTLPNRWIATPSIHTHNSLLPNFHSSFLSSFSLNPCISSVFPPLFVSPLFLLHLAPYLIPLQSLYSPIPHPLASHSPMRISKPAWRHLYIHLSISTFFLPSLFSPFSLFSLFSSQAKGKLAASLSLQKGLFKLETLQSPHLPSFLPPHSLSPSSAFLPLSLGQEWLPPFLAGSLQGPVNARQLCFVDGSGGKQGWKERGNEGEEK